ncbi:MAG: hypothetical protein GX316_03460 [Firmicutes bacterium]|nr:hypothetical protein [Bacillota bacterium]
MLPSGQLTSFIGPKRPTIGLALGGGGLRGVAHIGVLEVLQNHGLQIDMIAGTSAGSIVAMLHALGWLPQDMIDFVLELNVSDYADYINNVLAYILMGLHTVLDQLAWPHHWLPPAPMGIIKGKRLERLLGTLSASKDFSQVKIPLFITATEICSGRLVCFCPPGFVAGLDSLRPEIIFTGESSLVKAVRASTAIPGVFQPARWQNRLLVDGGVKNNVPSDLLRWAGADLVIAVDLGFVSQANNDIDTILEIILQSLDIMGQTNTEIRLEQTADIIIQPKTGSASLSEVRKMPAMIETGRQAAVDVWPQIDLLMRNFCKRRQGTFLQSFQTLGHW